MHFRKAKALLLRVFKAKPTKQAWSPHLQDSRQPCSWAHLASAKQSDNCEAHFDSEHCQVDGQAVWLQSGNACTLASTVAPIIAAADKLGIMMDVG